MTDLAPNTQHSFASDAYASDGVLDAPGSTPALNDRNAGKLAKVLHTALVAACAALIFAAIAVVVLAPQIVGLNGLVFLAGLTGAGLVTLYTLLGGGGLRWSRDAGGEAALNAARASQAAAFDALSDPALITDRTGAPRAANRAFRELAREAGVLGESGLPPGFERVFGGHPGVNASIYRLARAGRRGEFLRERLPAVAVAAAGQRRAFDVEVAPLPAGEALWRAKERREGADLAGGEAIPVDDPMLDEAPVGFFSAAPDGRVLYMNATLRDWLGPRANEPNLRLKDIVAGDAGRVLGRGARPGGTAVRAEVTLRARDGIETPAVIVSTWPQSEGRPASRSVVFGLTNSAAPPGVAQALAAPSVEAGGLMDAMFANAPLGVARLSSTNLKEAQIEDANPALLHLTAGAAAPGKARFADLFDPAVGDVFEALANAQHGAGAEPVELALRPLDPDDKLAKPREVRVYFAQERGGRMAAYLVDVAEDKQIERQFFRAQKMQAIGLLAGKVAHDVNNFLASIELAAGNLLEDHPPGDPDYPTIKRITSNVARGAGLVRQLLAFASEETIRSEPLDLNEVLSEFGVLLRHSMEENMTVSVRHARELPVVKADKGQIESMIMNLATNARDAMQGCDERQFTITTRLGSHEELHAAHIDVAAPGDYAVIEASDTGAGMDEATMEKIFEPFFTTKEEGKGTGLGLATVFGIAKQSGGYVLVDSALGKGTTFRIFLPAYVPSQEVEVGDTDADTDAAQPAAAHDQTVDEAAQPAKAVVPPAEDLAGRGRILLVEDEDDLRWLAAKTLTRRGYEVVEANDGEVALEILQENPGSFDLLITDVVMPGLDGPTLLEEAREYLGKARVIFMSGYAEKAFSEALSRDREVQFLPKPFPNTKLAEIVKAELSKVDAE